MRDALDELPDLLQNALAHVAVVISDGGGAPAPTGSTRATARTAETIRIGS